MNSDYSIEQLMDTYQQGETLPKTTPKLSGIALLVALAATGCTKSNSRPMSVDKGYCGVATNGTVYERALLDTIARAEGTGPGKAGYHTLYGGRKFRSFKRHPNKKITKWGLTSTAAGRYQFLKETYDGLRHKGQFPRGRFSPIYQDRAALKLVKSKGVTKKDLEKGKTNFRTVANKIAPVWASIPRNGSSVYGQGARNVNDLEKQYNACIKIQRAKAQKHKPKKTKRRQKR